MFQVLVQPQARSALAQDARQRRLADLDRLAAQVGAVQLQQVEGVEEGVGLVAAAAQDVEPRQPALVAAHHLAVDQAGPHLEVVHGLDHERKAVRPVVAAPGNQPDADGIAPRHQAIAVVLDFVNPVGAGRRAVGRGRQARLDETQNGRHSGGYIAPALPGIELGRMHPWPITPTRLTAGTMRPART